MFEYSTLDAEMIAMLYHITELPNNCEHYKLQTDILFELISCLVTISLTRSSAEQVALEHGSISTVSQHIHNLIKWITINR